MSDSKIVAISGRLKSGKTTVLNYLYGLTITNLDLEGAGKLADSFEITDNGKLVLRKGDVFMPFEPRERGDLISHYGIDKHIKYYGFADALKQDVLINLLGLTERQCYDEKGKDEPTHLKWNDMPGVLTDKELCEKLETRGFKKDCIDSHILLYPAGRDAFMTGREVMQHVGTEIFRRIYGPVWIKRTLNKIKVDKPALAVIEDLRYPNEFFGVKEEGGKVIRLAREVKNKNSKHISETALDHNNFDWGLFDGVIAKDATIEQMNIRVTELLLLWGVI